jgi:hypothetical protein
MEKQASMTFDFNNGDEMIILGKDGSTMTASFVNNLDIIEDALEQVTPEEFDNIFSFYEYKLDEIKNNDNFELEKAINRDYEEDIKKLLQDNWNKVYPLIKDDLI